MILIPIYYIVNIDIAGTNKFVFSIYIINMK